MGSALETRVLHHHEILQFVDFQDGGSPSSWNFEFEIFSSQSLQRHILCYLVKLCKDRSNCCRYVAFFVFLNVMQKFTR